MEVKKIKNLEIPAVGFGTYTLNTDPIKKALKAGYRHLDTAKMYANEADVGDAWTSMNINRNELFITTKIWHDRLKPQQVKEDVEDSLRKLKSDYVDLLLIHWPSSQGIPLEDTLGAFEEVKKEGKARAIGTSNFTADMVEDAMKLTEVHCNQVEYHPFLGQKELLSLCEREDLVLIAYRPLAKSKISEEETIKELASKYKKSPTQIVLRWHVQQKKVIPIPRSTSYDHIKENLEIFDFELSESDMKQIVNLERGLRQVSPAFGPW